MGQRHFCKLDSFSFCPILDCKKIIQHSTSKKKCICQLDVRSATIQCLCCRHLDKMNALSEAEEAPSYFEKNDNLFQFPRIRNFRACIIYNSKNKSTNFNEALRYAYRHWIYSHRFREDDISRPELQKKSLTSQTKKKKKKDFLLFKVTLSYGIFPNNSVLLDKHEKTLPIFLPVLEDPLPHLLCDFDPIIFFCHKRSCFCRINTSSERLPITTLVQTFMRMSNIPFKIT